MRFWLDRGVDGFRVDVIHCIGKGPLGGPLDLSDDEPPWAGLPHCISHEHPSTHDHIRMLRCSSMPTRRARSSSARRAVPSTSMVAPYYGECDELHLAFNFAATYAPWEAAKWRTRVDRVVELLDPRAAWPTWVLGNHDMARNRTRYGGSETRARAAAFLLTRAARHALHLRRRGAGAGGCRGPA